MALLFYWYPSNFPAPADSTGIDAAEWRVIGGLIFGLAAIMLLNVLWNLPDLKPGVRVLATAVIVTVSLFVLWWAFPSADNPLPVDRADWFWLLALLIPVMLARWLLYGHPWVWTYLDPWLLAFIVLCVLSVSVAPYPSRGIKMLMRPLFGMALFIFIVSWAYRAKSVQGPLIVTMVLALFVGWISISATQWTTKSESFRGVLEVLPEWNPFFARGGFNPNEIAGAMSYLIPLAGGLVFYSWAVRWRVLSGVAFALLMSGLLLGQSRFAILGVVIALVCITLMAVPKRWRYLTLGGIGVAIAIQMVIFLNLLPSPSNDNIGVSSRDLGTSSQRFDIWDSAMGIIEDYPLTGVGMNRFRYYEVARDYPVVGYDIPDPDNPSSFRRTRPPHAHNEFFQIATDLGLPGLIVFVGIYVTAFYVLWRCWMMGDHGDRILALSIAGGFVAHMAYGMGDAIPVWDRFAFIYWILLGLTFAHYKTLKTAS